MTTAPAPMKAADLGALIDWHLTDPFTRIQHVLTDAYAAEWKMDGVRIMIRFGARRNKVIGGRSRLDLSANFPHLAEATIPGVEGLTLDGELIAAGAGTDQMLSTTVGLIQMNSTNARLAQAVSGPAEFYAFDITHTGETDLTRSHDRKPPPGYDERRELLGLAVDAWRAMYPGLPVHLVPSYPATAAAIRLAMDQGQEGVVIKRRDSIYQPGVRDGGGWHKVKTVTTADAVITGWRAGEGDISGLVGSLEVSLWQGDLLVPVGHVGTLTARFRQQVTDADGSLRPEWYGRVIEFAAQGVNKRGKVRHPRLVRVRHDKASLDCAADQLDAFARV